jgi:cation:H+ antiporter
MIDLRVGGGWGRSDSLSPVLVDIVFVVVGLVLLAKAADHFVTGAARLAGALRVAPVVIGAVVIGIGTSAPEALVSSLAAGQGKLDIAVGNVIGSNAANLTLVLGVAAIIAPIRTPRGILRRELPLALVATVAFAVVVQDGIARWESIALLVGLVLALVVLLVGSRSRGGEADDDLAAEVTEYLATDGRVRVGAEVVRTLLGLVGTVAGAQAMVTGASGIANEMGLGEGFVGLTLVAIGTSLPELVTAIAAARKGEDELIIGNLLGSNLFNSLAVAGLAGVIGPGPLADPTLSGFAVLLMLGVSAGAALAMIGRRAVVRWEGLLLLAVYAGTVPLLAL